MSGSISGAVTGAITSGISGACFVAGTPVLTEDGLVPIEMVAAGMLVLAEDPETGEKGLRQVVRKFVRETDELTHVTISDKNGNTEIIDCTPEHPFYIEGQGWVGAGSLHKGMKVRFSSGAEGTIKDILCEELANPVAVYNFEVGDLHTYYVGENSLLVHNTCKFDPNQQSVLDLAKENKNGLSMQDAETLWNWSQEYGITGHGPMSGHGKLWQGFHIKIKNYHIPILPD